MAVNHSCQHCARTRRTGVDDRDRRAPGRPGRGPGARRGAAGDRAAPVVGQALDGLKGENDDQTRGIDIIRKALNPPLRQIAENAGHDGAVVAGKLIDANDPNLRDSTLRAKSMRILVQAGVIDPTKVVRAALQDAASVAGLLITTEATIALTLPMTSRLRRWPAVAWAAWVEWTFSGGPTA